MKQALLIIDVQNDYFKDGKMELVNPEHALEKINQLEHYFNQNNLPIIYIQHISLQADATFFLPNSEGINIPEQIAPRANEKVIIKHFPDSFYNTGLNEHLATLGINHLVICGMMSHMCIDTTVRSAKRLGYNVSLLSDACTTKALVWNNETIPAETVHKTFMASLHGTFANVIDTHALTNR